MVLEVQAQVIVVLWVQVGHNLCCHQNQTAHGWTTEIQECHRLTSTQMEEPTQQQRDDTAPWEQLPYKCRIGWTLEGTEILKQRSLENICSQPDDNTYYTDGSSDGTRVAAAVVHKEEEIIIRLNDSASVLDAKITIHTDSLTAVNILNNRKLDDYKGHQRRGIQINT